MIDEVKTAKPKDYLVGAGEMTLLVSYAITACYQLVSKLANRSEYPPVLWLWDDDSLAIAVTLILQPHYHRLMGNLKEVMSADLQQ